MYFRRLNDTFGKSNTEVSTPSQKRKVGTATLSAGSRESNIERKFSPDRRTGADNEESGFSEEESTEVLQLLSDDDTQDYANEKDVFKHSKWTRTSLPQDSKPQDCKRRNDIAVSDTCSKGALLPAQCKDDGRVEDTEKGTHASDKIGETLIQSGVLTIGLVGQPNVGKSSLINALTLKKSVSTSRTPGHTKHLQVYLFI